MFFKFGCLLWFCLIIKNEAGSRRALEPDPRSLSSSSTKIVVNLDEVISETDERFLSIALDTGLIVKHWKSVDFSSESFNTLARGLSPAYLRVGGNAADFLIFREKLGLEYAELDDEQYMENYAGMLGIKNLTDFYMTGLDFDKVNKFAVRNGLRLLFDFNVLLRDKHGHWNSSNAQEILRYCIKKEYDTNQIFSLGNEPNSFHHAFNRSLSAHQLGKDFQTLNNLLRNDRSFSFHFNGSLLIGPDVTQPKKQSLQYLNDVLDVAASKLNAVTFHHYYLDGRTATLDDMTSVDVLDTLVDELKLLVTSLEERGHPNVTLWFGEAGSCWGGGAKELSDAYVAGFMWLDKLGLSAKHGLKVVVRQSLFGGNYALVDKSFDPNPDYWLSWLYKNLVGRKVFSVEVRSSGDVRMYAHCAQHPKYTGGAVAVFGMNLNDKDVTLQFGNGLSDQKKHLYWLSPFDNGDLKSKLVVLNDNTQPLRLTDDAFPDINPVTVAAGSDVVVGGFSFGFIVFPDAKAENCLS